MKERPILFSGPMVRAILNGSKTQTRRIVKPQPYAPGYKAIDLPPDCHITDLNDMKIKCPYGQPGDRLWVRETIKANPSDIYYAADEKTIEYDNDSQPEFFDSYGSDQKEEVTIPSIHIPRWASRITLEIVNIRVERLNEISEEDAKAEGVSYTKDEFEKHRWCFKDEFEKLWESIHGPGSWKKNPWVWVIGFRRVKP